MLNAHFASSWAWITYKNCSGLRRSLPRSLLDRGEKSHCGNNFISFVKMRILLIHTYYQQPGGEDAVFEAEKALLNRMGHEVIVVTFHNRDLARMPAWWQVAVTIWNGELYRSIRSLIREKRPEIMHIHNNFPLASPAVIHAAKAEGLPLVMTLHNYRLLCVNGLFFRQGRSCEDCIGRLPWRGVVHGCYRDSRVASAVVACMLTFHRSLGTWDLIDRFIALTEFACKKFIEAGLPVEKIMVKPNFVPDPGRPETHEGNYALLVSRLVPEKGIETVLKAWSKLPSSIPLKIVGSGPLEAQVREYALQNPSIEYMGQMKISDVFEVMKKAFVVLFSSEWYETFGRTIIESFACGKPVIVSNFGAATELVEEGRTGLKFRVGDANDLAAKVKWAWLHKREMAEMGHNARKEYELKYTADRNYQMLMDIYQAAIGHLQGKSNGLSAG